MKRFFIALVFLLACGDPQDQRDDNPVEFDTYKNCLSECTDRCVDFCVMEGECYEGNTVENGWDVYTCISTCKHIFETGKYEGDDFPLYECIVNCDPSQSCDDWIACGDDCEK